MQEQTTLDKISNKQDIIAKDIGILKTSCTVTASVLSLFFVISIAFCFFGLNSLDKNTTRIINALNQSITALNQSNERSERRLTDITREAEQRLIKITQEAEKRLTKILEKSLDNINEVSKKIDNLKLK